MLSLGHTALHGGPRLSGRLLPMSRNYQCSQCGRWWAAGAVPMSLADGRLLWSALCWVSAGPSADLPRLLSVQRAPPRSAVPWTLAALVLGLSTLFSSSTLLGSVSVSPPGDMAWKLFQGSKLGWLQGSPLLFPTSQGSLSFVAWCSVSWICCLLIWSGFLGCFR